MLWFWGGAGAFTYAAGALGLALWGTECETRDACIRMRLRAIYDFLVAIATGCIFAAALAQIGCDILATGVNLNGAAFKLTVPPIAMALFIGWSGNFLWPRILRRLGDRVERVVEPGGAGKK